MSDPPLVPSVPTLSRQSGGQCQVFLDVRPDVITVIAQVRFDSSATGRTSNLESSDLPDSARQLLQSVLGRVDDFLDRFRGQVDGPLALALPGPQVDLWEENRRLRSALEECVATCEPLLDQADEGAYCDGREGEHGQAWLAIDAARQLLEESSAQELPSPPALPQPGKSLPT